MSSSLQVAGNVFLGKGFTAHGTGKLGTVRLTAARIEGHLNCSDATITNPCGPAIQAGGALQVASRVSLHRIIAHGAGKWGAIWMGGARIGGQLDCSGATITNPCGPALRADFLHAAGLFLRKGFTADGASELGTIRLIGARIDVHLDCSDAVVTSRSDPQHRWTLDGLTYAGLPLDPLGQGSTGWLDLLRTATPIYAAQPYQQLALAYRSAGHDRDTRNILIAQRQDQLDRKALTGRGERWWARTTGLTLGYGYQPWRALLILLGVVVISVVLALTLGAHGALIHPQDPKNPTPATLMR